MHTDAPIQGQLYRRAFALAALLLIVVAVAVGRLAYLQFHRPPWVRPNDEAQPITLPAHRGNIYDAHGYLLAVDATVYDIEAMSDQITDRRKVAQALAPLLQEPAEELQRLLQSKSGKIHLKRVFREEAVKSIQDLGLQGVLVIPKLGRVYPHEKLAASVLGFVNDEGKASYGVEAYYDQFLAGKAGSRVVERDAMGCLRYKVQPACDGMDLYLTLDRNMQWIVEDVLAKAVEENQAKKGIAIVMDPKTGAILAMAVYPTYDPNTREVADENVYMNSAISEPYEPGSVFKIVTIVSALDAGVITPSSTYYDQGRIVVGGRVISNASGVAYGQTTMTDLLAHSLNVGAAHVSMKLGARKFYDYVERFGFGQLTGVDLAYELPGWVRQPGDREWHESDLGTNSFGQGLAATPLQMLCAVAAVANQGVMMRPHVVARIVDGDRITEIPPQVAGRVVSAEAAAQVTEMLVYAVDNVLTLAAIPGYRVAGKSGTSQIAMPSGAYDPEATIASFAGYVPADDPRLAILVVLHRPEKEHWGIRAAAPAFREIAQRLLVLLAVPPDQVRLGMQ
jgi:cell division protein FtsI (penicillin-binding protein 3)